MILQKGTSAPDFELYSTPEQKLRLSELKGKRIMEKTHKIILQF